MKAATFLVRPRVAVYRSIYTHRTSQRASEPCSQAEQIIQNDQFIEQKQVFPLQRGLLGADRWDEASRAELPSDLSNGISAIVGRGELFTVLVIIDHFSGSGLRLSPLSVIIMATSCKLVVSGTFLWPNRPQSSAALGRRPQLIIFSTSPSTMCACRCFFFSAMPRCRN